MEEVPAQLLSRAVTYLAERAIMRKTSVRKPARSVRRRTSRPRKKVTRKRTFKRRQRLEIGESKTHLSSQTHVFLEPGTGSSSRLLNLGADLTDIPAMGGAATIVQPNYRLNNRIMIGGFKICYMVNMIRAVATRIPFVFHFAIVMRKAGGQTPTSNNFLGGAGAEEGIDLDLARNGMEMACCPINTDQYAILLHHRIKLYDSQISNDAADRAPFTSRMKEVYVPLKRQITYDSATSLANERIFIVHWGDYATSTSGISSLANVYDLRYRAITYFKNIVGT